MTINIYKVKDGFEKYHTAHRVFDIPFKLCICGKSGMSGKSTIIVNLLLRSEFYLKKFNPENIYIITDNKLDAKLKILQKEKEIPDENVMQYDEQTLHALYELLEEEFVEQSQSKGKVPNKLVVFDDCGYSGNLKNKDYGVIAKLAANGRHANISQIYTVQKYTMLNTIVRENLTAGIFFSASNKQLDLIEQDHNMLESKKQFFKMFKSNTKEKHDFIVINYSKPYSEMFMSKGFKPIVP